MHCFVNRTKDKKTLSFKTDTQQEKDKEMLAKDGETHTESDLEIAFLEKQTIKQN